MQAGIEQLTSELLTGSRDMTIEILIPPKTILVDQTPRGGLQSANSAIAEHSPSFAPWQIGICKTALPRDPSVGQVDTELHSRLQLIQSIDVEA